MDRRERRKFLLDRRGFYCICSRCLITNEEEVVMKELAVMYKALENELVFTRTAQRKVYIIKEMYRLAKQLKTFTVFSLIALLKTGFDVAAMAGLGQDKLTFMKAILAISKIVFRESSPDSLMLEMMMMEMERVWDLNQSLEKKKKEKDDQDNNGRNGGPVGGGRTSAAA